MMNMKYTLATLSLVAGVALAAPMGSETDPSTSNTTSGNPTPAAANMVSGTVKTIDSTNSSVQIKDPTGNLQTVKVDAGTQISRNGNPVQLSDVKIGDVVSIQLSSTNGTM